MVDGPKQSASTTAVKIIEVLGTFEESWERAAENAVGEASNTVESISGVEVEDWTADVEGGAVTNYKATVEIAFPVKGSESGENEGVNRQRVSGSAVRPSFRGRRWPTPRRP